MTMGDPLGDMLTRIRNGQRARQAIVAGIPTYLVIADDGVPRRLLADDVRLG